MTSAGPLRIVLLLGNPFVADSRSWKIARSLAARGHTVTVVARRAPGLPDEEVVDGARVLRLPPPPLGRMLAPRLPAGAPAPADAVVPRSSRATRIGHGAAGLVRETVGRGLQAIRYLRFARATASQIAAVVDTPDIWQAEGLVSLPIALHLRQRMGGAVVYDSRDLDVRSARFDQLPAFWRRLLLARERGWARAADAIVTTNRQYARAIEAATGRSPVIVWNGPLAADGEPSRRAREELGIPDAMPIVLVLGQLAADRGLEPLCQAMGEVPGAALVLVGDGTHARAIRELRASLPWADRIYIHGSVHPSDIPAWTASADVVAMPIQGTTPNHRLTTPTRLFDALGAGVPVVASDLPGMAEIVRETGCGELCDPESPSSIAAGIRAVLEAPPERREAYRRSALAAAAGPFAWDRQAEVLLGVYASARGEQGPVESGPSGIVPP